MSAQPTKTSLHRAQIKTLVACHPYISTPELMAKMKITATQFHNAFYAIAGQFDTTIESKRVHRHVLKGKPVVVSDGKPARRECVPMANLPMYMGEKPANRISL